MSSKFNTEASERLIKSVFDDNANGVRHALDDGADPDYLQYREYIRDDYSEENNCLWTPLHHAAYTGRAEICRILLEHGANINALTIDKITPFNKAIENGNKETIQVFLDYNVNVNEADYNGITPLNQVCKCPKEFLNNIELAKMLLGHNADPNIADHLGYTPLMQTVFRNNIALCEILLKNGANSNAYNRYKYSALGIACSYMYLQMAETLIKYGAQINNNLDLWGFARYGNNRHGKDEEGLVKLKQYIANGHTTQNAEQSFHDESNNFEWEY